MRARRLWASAHARKAARAVTRYEVRDETGALVAVHCRQDETGGKRIWWELPDGTLGLGATRVEHLPLYGAERLPELPEGAPIVVTEGEKAAQALRTVGIEAVGTVTGASGTPGSDALRPLARLAVYLWPDADQAGLLHMMNVAAVLADLGVCHKVLRWPEARDKGDAGDFVQEGGNAEDVRRLMTAAVDLWEQPDTAGLLNDMAAVVRSYVVMTGHQANALALWVLHTHAIDAADVTPYPLVKSAEKRCGKSRVLDVLEGVVRRPWKTGRVTAAVLIRKVDAEGPTLLLDESDAAFKADKEYSEALRGILNNGYARGGVASVCVGHGANIGYKDFSVFSPKCIAGIGRLPDTIEDRGIPVELKRKRPDEQVQRFRRRTFQPQAERLRERLERWATLAVPRLRDAQPALLDALDDRAADVWEPLFAIADLAGGAWPVRARDAALALSAGREDDSLGVRLLADIKAVFDEAKTDRMATTALLDALKAIEESPWNDLKGRPIDAARLARMLKPYNVKPKERKQLSIRLADGSVVKGYLREWFEDAFSRYLPASREQGLQELQGLQAPDSDSPPVTAVTDVTAKSEMREPDHAWGDGCDGSHGYKPFQRGAPICSHRPAGEPDALWGMDVAAWGEHPTACECCGAPVRDNAGDDGEGRCPSCRLGRVAPERGGHIVRFALDMGGTLVGAAG